MKKDWWQLRWRGLWAFVNMCSLPRKCGVCLWCEATVTLLNVTDEPTVETAGPRWQGPYEGLMGPESLISTPSCTDDRMEETAIIVYLLSIIMFLCCISFHRYGRNVIVTWCFWVFLTYMFVTVIAYCYTNVWTLAKEGWLFASWEIVFNSHHIDSSCHVDNIIQHY